MGNNRGAAFRLGVREEAGCRQGGGEGRRARGAPPQQHTPSHLPEVLGGWGHFAVRSRMEEGKIPLPVHGPHPSGVLHLLRFLVQKVGSPLVARN